MKWHADSFRNSGEYTLDVDSGKLSYATTGSGTAMHLSVELPKTATGIDIVHVPYKGGARAQQDVMGGRVPILLDVLYAAQPIINSGKVKVIAVLGPKRTTQYPIVAETVPGVSALSIVGIVAPAGVPGRVRRAHPRRDRQVGARGQGLRRESRLS